MPLEPVTEYDEAQYPTHEEMAYRRRDFLRRVGLAAIAAAFGPHAPGCSAGGGTEEVNRRTQVPQLAGVAAPPRWPGPRGAIVGGGPIQVTYADGVTGWVVVAAVFNPSNERLEAALLDAEARVSAVVRDRLGHERSGFLANAQSSRAAEVAILQSLRATVGVNGLDSIALAEVDSEAARAGSPKAPPPPPAEPAQQSAPSTAAPRFPALAAPAPAPPPMDGSARPIRRLPRAGGKCPLHPSGCRRSETSGA